MAKAVCLSDLAPHPQGGQGGRHHGQPGLHCHDHGVGGSLGMILGDSPLRARKDLVHRGKQTDGAMPAYTLQIATILVKIIPDP